jgi:S1-C subfamily serine protease
MKKNILKLLPVLFLISTISSYSQNAVEIAKKTFPSTVSIVALDKSKQPISLGSGFVVDKGKVITNVHVMKGAVYGEIIEDQTKKTHKIVGYLAIDKINDLILLSVPTLEVDKLALSEKTPEIGEKIYAIGNPKGLSGTISEGIVSGIRKIENNDLIQITAPISPGSSGGPIINNNGEVIAVSVASLTSGQNLNFAIPAKYVNNILSKNINSVTKLNIPNVNTTPTKTKSTSIKEGVYVSDIVWTSRAGYDPSHDTFGQYLSRFSITNNTENEIKDISIIAIVFKNNMPIDYLEFKLFQGQDSIKPYLGKTIVNSFYNTNNRFYIDYNGIKCDKNIDEKVVFRILDYKIIE